MKWGYLKGAGFKIPAPVNINIESHPHALITGSSGSGKSYALLFLLGSVLKENPKIDIFFCDFKNSKDFSFLKGYPHYYSGDMCEKGVMEYYRLFTESRQRQVTYRRRLLIFDEYPAFINYLSGIDKREKSKRTNDILGAIAEILMLGRGISYGAWITTQRADSSLFSNGARDNFMIVTSLGRLSKEQKGMIFSGEDIPDRNFLKGEGLVLADGMDLKEVYFPKIINLYEWKWHIREILIENRILG